MTYWLMPLASGVGFHKPIAATAGRQSSPVRASSPPGDQGGSIEPLTGGSSNRIWTPPAHGTPRSQFDVVGWRDFPVGAPSPSRLPPPQTFLRQVWPFGCAGASHVPATPARPAWRRQSADADDCGRPAFLLEPPSGHPLRPQGRHWTLTSRDTRCSPSQPSHSQGGKH